MIILLKKILYLFSYIYSQILGIAIISEFYRNLDKAMLFALYTIITLVGFNLLLIFFFELGWTNGYVLLLWSVICDLIIFGAIFTHFNTRKERIEKIRKALEDIEVNRKHRNPESDLIFQTSLNSLSRKIYKGVINYSNTIVDELNLVFPIITTLRINLHKTVFNGSSGSSIYLPKISFWNIDFFCDSSFVGTILKNISLENCIFRCPVNEAIFTHTIIYGYVEFNGCMMTKTEIDSPVVIHGTMVFDNIRFQNGRLMVFGESCENIIFRGECILDSTIITNSIWELNKEYFVSLGYQFDIIDNSSGRLTHTIRTLFPPMHHN